MTISRRDKQDTQYGSWIRNHPLLDSKKYGFDAQNLDYIWFAFREGWYILIEEKRKLAKQSLSQKDTHCILHQHLQCVPMGTKVCTFRGKREIEYRGYYLIQFQKTNPDDSQWCKINGVYYDKPEIHILWLQKFGFLLKPDINFDLFPIALAEQAKITVKQAVLLKTLIIGVSNDRS